MSTVQGQHLGTLGNVAWWWQERERVNLESKGRDLAVVAGILWR